jgi:lipooligosaccharide transport system permease protein
MKIKFLLMPDRQFSESIGTRFLYIRAVWQRNFDLFKKNWWVSLFWTVLEPIVILLGLGLGLGSYISSIKEMPYIDFFFPALICNSAMMVSFFTSSYDGFSKLTYQNLYKYQMTTPIEPREIAYGEMLWNSTKGLIVAAGVLVVGGAFGLIKGPEFLLLLPIAFILSLITSAFGMIVTTIVKNYDQVYYPTSGLIIPLSLFSGTYFPLEQMPLLLRIIMWVFPLTHAVFISRSIVSEWSWWMLASLAYLIIFCFCIMRYAGSRLYRRLIG